MGLLSSLVVRRQTSAFDRLLDDRGFSSDSSADDLHCQPNRDECKRYSQQPFHVDHPPSNLLLDLHGAHWTTPRRSTPSSLRSHAQRDFTYQHQSTQERWSVTVFWVLVPAWKSSLRIGLFLVYCYFAISVQGVMFGVSRIYYVYILTIVVLGNFSRTESARMQNSRGQATSF
jgi:hypothetical protein